MGRFWRKIINASARTAERGGVSATRYQVGVGEPSAHRPRFAPGSFDQPAYECGPRASIAAVFGQAFIVVSAQNSARRFFARAPALKSSLIAAEFPAFSILFSLRVFNVRADYLLDLKSLMQSFALCCAFFPDGNRIKISGAAVLECVSNHSLPGLCPTQGNVRRRRHPARFVMGLRCSFLFRGHFAALRSGNTAAPSRAAISVDSYHAMRSRRSSSRAARS